MLSDASNWSGGERNQKVVSRIKIQTAILKAIHDFLEEQQFSQILPHTLPNLTQQIVNLDNHEQSDHLNSGHQESDSMVISHQMLIGNLEMDKIYSISSATSSSYHPAHLDLEFSNIDFDNVTMFLERLLRRIKIDLETKASDSLRDLQSINDVWNGTFPVLSSHDIELEFGDDWQSEATSELNLPFFVTCVTPKFYDSLDKERNGNHYLNFELYIPHQPKPIVRGGQREYVYGNLINQMKMLNINRFYYSNYLIYTSNGGLRPTSGASVNLDNLISSFIGNLSSLS